MSPPVCAPVNVAVTEGSPPCSVLNAPCTKVALPDGGGGGGVCDALPATRNAATFITHQPEGLTGADATYIPAAVTLSSSTMSEFGDVIIRLVNPLPGPGVPVSMKSPATI